MTRQYSIEVVTYERKELVVHTCDICGANLANIPYSVDDVTIEYDNGSRFPDSSYGTLIEFDICPACFDAKVMPALEALGAKAIITEYER